MTKKGDVRRLTLGQLKGVLRARVTQAGSARKLAAQLGVTHSKISEALANGSEPQPAIVAALGYRKAESRYESLA